MARRLVAASSQYLENTTLTVPSLPVSFACWFRPTSIGALQVLMGFTDSASNNLRRLRIAAGGTLAAQELNNPTNGLAESAGVLSAGVWAFCGGVFTSATSRTMYLGTESVTDTTNVTPTGLDRLIVGANAAPAQFADGDMAEIGIWTEALNAGEMGMLSRGYAPSTVRPWALKRYYPLRDGQSPEPDKSLSGDAPLTLVNAPATSSHPPFIIYPSAVVSRGRRRRRG